MGCIYMYAVIDVIFMDIGRLHVRSPRHHFGRILGTQLNSFIIFSLVRFLKFFNLALASHIISGWRNYTVGGCFGCEPKWRGIANALHSVLFAMIASCDAYFLLFLERKRSRNETGNKRKRNETKTERQDKKNDWYIPESSWWKGGRSYKSRVSITFTTLFGVCFSLLLVWFHLIDIYQRRNYIHSLMLHNSHEQSLQYIYR